MANRKATKMTSGVALMASELPETDGGVPEWIQILPAGKMETVDGRGPFTIANASTILASSLEKAGGKLVVDENHGTDLTGKQGHPARAVGWVTEMEARKDGVWAKVDWTKLGRQLVEDRAYRGVSPVITYTKANRILRVWSISLTNDPALCGMESLHQRTEDPENQMETTMDLSVLISALGLEEGTSEEDVLAAIKKLTDAKPEAGDEALLSALKPIAAKLGKDVPVEGKAILAALETALDPKSMVPMASFSALQAEVSELKGSTSRDKAEAAVDAAIEAGKPGISVSRDYFVSLHMADPEGTDKAFAGMPSLTVTKLGGKITLQNADKGKDGLTAGQRSIAAMLGVDAAAYAKTLETDAIKQEAL